MISMKRRRPDRFSEAKPDITATVQGNILAAKILYGRLGVAKGALRRALRRCQSGDAVMATTILNNALITIERHERDAGPVEELMGVSR